MTKNWSCSVFCQGRNHLLSLFFRFPTIKKGDWGNLAQLWTKLQTCHDIALKAEELFHRCPLNPSKKEKKGKKSCHTRAPFLLYGSIKDVHWRNSRGESTQWKQLQNELRTCASVIINPFYPGQGNERLIESPMDDCSEFWKLHLKAKTYFVLKLEKKRPAIRPVLN